MLGGNLSDRSHHNLVMKLCSIFVIVSLLPLACADLNSDKKALVEFAATVPHGPKLKWSANTSICTSWVGIKCNSDGSRVISVRLPAIGLTGPIPPNTLGKLDALRVVSFRSNYLNESLPYLLSLPSLRSLFLQHNNFTTNIPSFFPHRLHILDLSFNSFTGNIPPNITRLTRLYLQNNSLSGRIPYVIFLNLQHVNISYNNLRGTIPFSLKTFPTSSFLGNPMLCGLPLKPCSKRKLPLWGILVISAVGGGLAIIVISVTFVLKCLRKHENVIGDKPSGGVDDNQLVFFDGSDHKTFDLEELLSASAQVIGKGSFGTTYKAVMEESMMTLVVKRLNQVVVSKQEFEHQMEIIERVGYHQNVVPLRAFFYSQDEKLLVYDYYAAGGLMTLLHGNREGGAFDWESRVKIAIGSAKGIAHIHSIGGAGLSHGNIKSSNILIDQDMNPLITDMGLIPIMNPVVPVPAPGGGYQAPENQHSHKSDVYSFGVLLLEMLTGKQPMQSPVVSWVQSVVTHPDIFLMLT